MSALAIETRSFDPSNSYVPLNDQILALLQIGNYNQAEFALKQAVAINAADFKSLYYLGYCALHQQRYQDAIGFFKKVISNQPKFADSYGAIGNCYRSLGYFYEAERFFRKAIQRAPKHNLYYSNLGDVLFQQGKLSEARSALVRAVALDDRDANAHYNLAVVYSMLGQQKQKQDHCLRALKASPSHGRAFYLLSLDKNNMPNADLCETMEQLLWDNSLSISDRMYIYFGLAHVHENAGDFETALVYFSRGNQFKRKEITFDSSAYVSHVAAICQQFYALPKQPASISNISPVTPVFIVGMPRSGTTLIEQILHQHRSVHGAGELLFIEEIIQQYEQQSGMPYPEFMNSIPAEELSRMGNEYMARLSQAAGKKASFIIDKLPGNFIHVGFIKAILPNAKFIYCKRHYLDTAVSIFRQDFTGNIPYAYDLKEIGAVSAVCQKMMEHWKSLLDDMSLLEVAYEDVIADTRSEVEKMLHFLGLTWEEKCLEFHKDWRLVKTASYDQVRRPVYQSSAGIHRHYEEALKPVVEAYRKYVEAMSIPSHLQEKSQEINIANL